MTRMNPPSTLSRSLAPLAGIFWALFIVTSVLVAIVWLTGFGDAAAAEPWFKRAFPNQELRSSLVLLSRAIDPAWIALGAVAVYLAIARNEGLALARRWTLVTMITGFLVTMMSAKTRWPSTSMDPPLSPLTAVRFPSTSASPEAFSTTRPPSALMPVAWTS